MALLPNQAEADNLLAVSKQSILHGYVLLA